MSNQVPDTVLRDAKAVAAVFLARRDSALDVPKLHGWLGSMSGATTAEVLDFFRVAADELCLYDEQYQPSDAEIAKRVLDTPF